MKHRQKGSIVIFALIILAFVLTAALSVAAVTLINRRSANISVNSSVAFQNSDKGMEEFLQQLYKDVGPNGTLNDVAVNINHLYGDENYTCRVGGDVGNVATIGDTSNRFIITAYQETELAKAIGQSGWGTVDINTDTEQVEIANPELVPIDQCDATLSSIDRFKVVGNQNNAVRAVFVKLRGSSDRGLVAHWPFEDWRYMSIVYSSTSEHKAYIAQDFSRNRHAMELCRRRDGDKNVTITDPFSGAEYDVREAEKCRSSADDYILPVLADDASGFSSSEPQDARGMWTNGFVRTSGVTGGIEPGMALRFGALPNIVSYLTVHVESHCQDGRINCVQHDADGLLVQNGITISAWVKSDTTVDANHGSVQSLVSRWEGDDGSSGDGYRMYIDNGKFCFQINNRSACSADGAADTEWHHVVGRWTKGDNVEIIVDDVLKSSDLSIDSISYKDETSDNGNNIFIGADMIGSDAVNAFKGVIDDVRVWNRALLDPEVLYVCQQAQNISFDATTATSGDVACYVP